MRESQRPSEKPRQTRQTGQTRQASAQSRRTASKRYEERAKRSKRHGQRHEQHGHHGKRHERRRAPPKYQPHARQRALVEPPAPPIELTPLVACSADTAQDVLWHIAEYAPRLRKWLVANPSATPAMLEYLAQVGGPGVPEALRILLKSLEMNGSGSDQPSSQARHCRPACDWRASRRTADVRRRPVKSRP